MPDKHDPAVHVHRAAPGGEHGGGGAPSPRRPGNTDVETFQIVKWISGSTTGSQQIPELQIPAEETYRPARRPPMPILTVLDDGAVEEGEHIRIRKESFVIGRSAGDLTIPFDPTMSARHAEIRLTTDRSGQRQWMLHNLESVNGTFVRVATAALGDDTIVILGSKRFRLEQPAAEETAARVGDTFRLDQPAAGQAWPLLVESAGGPKGLRLPLTAGHVTIGRKGGGCGIQIDDPLLAPVHAELFIDTGGTWKISGRKTRNGVWVNTAVAPLASCCFFQCGEQRFKFVLP